MMKFWASLLVLGMAMFIAACGTATNVKGTELRGGAESSGLLDLNTPDTKLGICHHAGPTDNNWVYLEIDSAAIPAHQAHGDVFGVRSQADCNVLAGIATPMPGIPTVTPFGPTATPTVGATVSPTRTAAPLPAAVNGSAKVGICHRTKSDSNPYVYIVVSLSAVPAHRKHGDIIGVAGQNDCPKTAIRGAGSGNDNRNHGKGGKGNGKHKGSGKNKNNGNEDKGEKDD